MSKHTPGPWLIVVGREDDSWGITHVNRPGTQTVAQMVWSYDAPLIAAAPDLLAHLKHCASLLGAVAGDLESERFFGIEYVNNLKKARDEAQALIAKVEG